MYRLFWGLSIDMLLLQFLRPEAAHVGQDLGRNDVDQPVPLFVVDQRANLGAAAEALVEVIVPAEDALGGLG